MPPVPSVLKSYVMVRRVCVRLPLCAAGVLVAGFAALGCGSSETPSPPRVDVESSQPKNPSEVPEIAATTETGRPVDSTQTRILMEGGGDRWEDWAQSTDLDRGRAGRQKKPHPGKNPGSAGGSAGDWNYRMYGPVTGGVAVYNPDGTWWNPVALSCNSVLFVPVQRTNGANLVAFNKLYKTDSKNVACGEPSPKPSDCSQSPDGHCPSIKWSKTLQGGFNRSGATLSKDAKLVYAASANGYVYGIDAATGNQVFAFNAQTDTGKADATFAGRREPARTISHALRDGAGAWLGNCAVVTPDRADEADPVVVAVGRAGRWLVGSAMT